MILIYHPCLYTYTKIVINWCCGDNRNGSWNNGRKIITSAPLLVLIMEVLLWWCPKVCVWSLSFWYCWNYLFGKSRLNCSYKKSCSREYDIWSKNLLNFQMWSPYGIYIWIVLFVQGLSTLSSLTKWATPFPLSGLTRNGEKVFMLHQWQLLVADGVSSCLVMLVLAIRFSFISLSFL